MVEILQDLSVYESKDQKFSNRESGECVTIKKNRRQEVVFYH